MMKKIRFYLAAAILALSVLSGCGMARDGYIEDAPHVTTAPIESPYLPASPMPTKAPADEKPTQDGASNGSTNGTANGSTNGSGAGTDADTGKDMK